MMEEFRVDLHKHRGYLGGRRIPSVTDVLRDLGFVETRFYPPHVRIRGAKVHQACHLLDTIGLDWESLKPIEEALQEPIIPYVKGWQRFRLETGFIPERIEQPLYSRRYRIWGIPDDVGRFPDGRRAIVDAKTAETPAAWWELQLGGYDELELEAEFAAGMKPGYRDLLAVQLLPTGDWRPWPVKNKLAGKIFLSMTATHRWGFEHGYYKKTYAEDEDQKG